MNETNFANENHKRFSRIFPLTTLQSNLIERLSMDLIKVIKLMHSKKALGEINQDEDP